MAFSVMTRNLNLEILAKNLLTFKRWDEVKDEKFNILEAHWKSQFLKGVHEKPIYQNLLTRMEWTYFSMYQRSCQRCSVKKAALKVFVNGFFCIYSDAGYR